MERLFQINQDILENKFCNSLFNIHTYDIFKDVYDFLNKYEINNILISLSGGVDSMVLLEIIRNIQINNENMKHLKILIRILVTLIVLGVCRRISLRI